MLHSFVQTNTEFQRFLDSLNTSADIDAAFRVVASIEQARSGVALASYAQARGFDFIADEADCWLTRFHDSIADSDLRSRWKASRLRQINDWAAFFALERELKIDLPEEQYIGNPWWMDSLDESGRPPANQIRRFFRRCRDYWLGTK